MEKKKRRQAFVMSLSVWKTAADNHEGNRTKGGEKVKKKNIINK
jgi:hypothetical protein